MLSKNILYVNYSSFLYIVDERSFLVLNLSPRLLFSQRYISTNGPFLTADDACVRKYRYRYINIFKQKRRSNEY